MQTYLIGRKETAEPIMEALKTSEVETHAYAYVHTLVYTHVCTRICISVCTVPFASGEG